MSAHFTIGIEEEFQMVDRSTGQLCPHIHTILEKGALYFGEKIKPEMMQSAVEITTDVCPNIAAVRLELQSLRATLAQLVAEDGIALISAGTHPDAHWGEQLTVPNPRYIEIEEELQDIVRAILIFSMQVHIGIEDLGSRREIHYLRMLLEDPRGTGADRQLAVYRETGSMHAVTQYLMQQTMEGITKTEEIVS